MKNPPWTRDELILALDLYQKLPSPDQTHPDVVALSKLLNQFWAARGGGDEKLRNANGVSMKLANFQRLDPVIAESGRKGLERGGKLEAEIWSEFSGERDRLAATARAIREAINAAPPSAATLDYEDDGVEAVEGALLTRLHRIRERDRKIVARKKAQAADAHGRIRCEACAFDFADAYGPRGTGFIEVHHLRALSTLMAGETTRLSELAVLCANCHRMVHARRPWLSLDELRALLTLDRAAAPIG